MEIKLSTLLHIGACILVVVGFVIVGAIFIASDTEETTATYDVLSISDYDKGVFTRVPVYEFSYLDGTLRIVSEYADEVPITLGSNNTVTVTTIKRTNCLGWTSQYEKYSLTLTKETVEGLL